jgi:hypothetical protein
MTTPTTEARVEGTLDPMLDDIREEANTWADLADIEDGPLGGNVVKAATYRGTATGLKMAEQIIMQHMSNAALTGGEAVPTNGVVGGLNEHT